TLAPPPHPVHGGDRVILDLYLYNPGAVPMVHQLPSTLPCRINTDRTTITVKAELLHAADMSRVDLPGKSIAKRQYGVLLPVYAIGAVRLRFITLTANPLLIPVKRAPSNKWVGQQVPLDEGPAMLQSFLADFSVYQPMYFLLGVEPGLEQSKFQFSFKYRLFNPNGYLAEKTPWISGFHLAYSQRSIWNLEEDSLPFDDTRYMPEIFYLMPKIDLHIDRVSAFGVQGGFQHESNGKADSESRSTNYLYIKPILGVHLGGAFHLRVAPKIFTYVNNEDENNGDLADYRGYVELETAIMDPEGIALSSHLWWAEEGASVQLDLTYPMSQLLGKSLNFYLQAQYFSGYGETLIRYDERNDAFRLGLSIVR
ncbi:MAG: phospholipase A, partial [Desulfosarcina sp.]